ncbi:MFS transporter [Marinivivus vitaminiproducens]|uniref:MFS transporter n=1 Tax=Marinivivus vitaminiproducens TaxID=3035935 RepID=UPI0027A14ED6|nr:MFS transporter [Geminicoccaceae bacterium SCSIO 64248]
MSRQDAPAAPVHAPIAGEGPLYRTPGTAAYRRIVLALFLAGFATFSLLYCVQPFLPVFAQTFAITPAQSSLALSLTTGLLALSILCAGAVSESLSRKRMIFLSICAAALLNITAALLPSWPLLLLARAAEGIALGGVPAVAMAYLAEEIDPRGLGYAMGIYVGSTAVGGMMGRVATSLIADVSSWRTALVVMGGLGLAAALGFAALLPPSRNFKAQRGRGARFHLRAWAGHLRNPGLVRLFLIAFLAMGAFVTIYNYATFRLLQPPFGLSQAAIGLIFTIYLVGSLASSTSGGVADRAGRAPVLLAGTLVAILGVLVTLTESLAGMIGGIVLLTVGFFIAHATASSWVGRLADGAKGHAASLYLLAYYLGSSVLGSAGGWFWQHGGWAAVSGYASCLLLLALLAGLGIRRRSAA